MVTVLHMQRVSFLAKYIIIHCTCMHVHVYILINLVGNNHIIKFKFANIFVAQNLMVVIPTGAKFLIIFLALHI